MTNEMRRKQATAKAKAVLDAAKVPYVESALAVADSATVTEEERAAESAITLSSERAEKEE